MVKKKKSAKNANKRPTKKPKSKNPVGRPSKYKPQYCQQIIDFFNVMPTKIVIERFFYKNGDEKEKEIEVANELPLIQDFCFKIGVTRKTLLDWTTKFPEFLKAYNIAKDLQEAMWIKNGLKGLYNPSFAIFTGKNMFGWRDQVTFEGDEDKPLQVMVKWQK